MTAADLARALGGRKSGEGWMARCPAHDDRNPSLSINDRGGRVLVHCFAGCPQDAVIEELKRRGLWETNNAKWREWRGVPYPAEWGEVVREHTYHDADGTELYRVVRFAPKSFRPLSRQANGEWKWRKPRRLVPYRLPAVLRNEYVFVTEGERDADVLAEYGFDGATTCPFGAGKWQKNWGQYFEDKIVLILADNDGPGREHAYQVAESLLVPAQHVAVIHLPLGKDAADFFALGGSETWLCHLVDEALGVEAA